MNRHRILAVHRRLKLISLTVVAFALAPAAAFAAGSPTDAQYDSTLQQFSQGSGGGSASSGGSLPFTGLDVVALVVVAAGLLVAGLMLRRHRPTQTTEG